MSPWPQQGAADRLPLLDLSQIMKLTDVAQAVFSALYDLERAVREDAKSRATILVRDLDLFGPGEHYRDDEEYWPGGDAR